jgi:polynucleotide 5'-hydroxyl-kinase GRC3/NOL9
MLSAVAARKAALAAQSAQTPELLVPSGSGTTSPKPPLPKNGGSKRKPSSQKTHAATKKSRKLKPFEKSNPRPVDAFKEQVDVIVVDSEGEDSDSAMSVLDDSEQEPISQPSKKSLEKRAWSPSRPVDSSEEDDSEPGDVANSAPLDLSSLFPHLHRAQEEQRDEGRVLSTFKVAVDENLFYLNEEELSSLGLSGAGCLVALNTGETLCLLGACTLTVLHGSVTVFGTTLSASFTTYPIYAPRSSPLPIIEPSNEIKSVLPSRNLPPRLRDLPLSKTVILIRELKTNVEGLGNICRTFDGAFQPSGWQRSSTNPFKVPGIFLVSGSYSQL